MNTKARASLEQYAKRRFVLSGTSAVKDQFPYCQPTEKLGKHFSDRDDGIVSFARYDYLGLADDVRVRQAAKTAIENQGVGAGASRLVGGEFGLHRELEQDLAQFLHVENTLALVSGYGANVALVSHLLTKGDLLLIDESCHNSIMVGAELSRAEAISFHHNDLDHLKEILVRTRGTRNRALVIVEGLYSMDGDIPDLPNLIELCRFHDAWLMIDEAHSIGVLGSTGRGITEHFGIEASEIDLLVGTLSKAFVSCGGFVAARQNVIEWLRYTLPGFVYSVGLSPPNAAAARTALAILQIEPERLKKLRKNSEYFAATARSLGLNLGKAIGGPVVPILLDDVSSTITTANILLNAGYFVPPIVQIAVPRDLPRLRFFLTADHTRNQIDGLMATLASIRGNRDRTTITKQLDAANAM